MDFSIAEDSKFLSKEGMQITKTFTRRSILGASAIAGTLSATAPFAKGAQHANSSKKSNLISKGNTILFQGDSITDAGRDKKKEVANKQKSFGHG